MKNELHIKSLLSAFIQKKTSAEDNVMIQEWLEIREENTNLFLRLKKLYEEESNPDYIKEQEITDEWEKVKSQMDQNVRKPSKKYAFLAIAASIVIIIGLIGTKLYNSLITGQPQNYATISGEKKSFLLEDGTEIWLNASSSLTIDKNYNNKERKVYLNGEAWFNVAKNKQKPFIVIADNITVKVYGTKFNISSYKWDNIIKTNLEEGRISLSTENSQPVFMNPGDEIAYNKKEQSIAYKTNSDIKWSSWKFNILRFEDTPLPIAVRKIEVFYGIKLHTNITLSERDLINMKIDNDKPESIVQLLNTITNNNFTIEKMNMN